MTQVSDDTLNKFIAGNLPDDEMQEIEAMLNNDPALCARVETLSAQATSELAQTVNAAIDSTVKDDVPAAITDMLEVPETVVPIDAANKPPAGINRFYQPAAIAASIAVAAVASLMLLQPIPMDVSLPGHTITALNSLTDGEQNNATIVGESYLNANGQFCRSFRLDGAKRQIGLACKSNASWELVALVTVAGESAYLPAGVDADGLLSQFTDLMRALDDGTEASYLSK